MGRSKKEPLTLDDGLPAPEAPDVTQKSVADSGREYIVMQRDIWINRDGKAIRVCVGDRVRMLPESAQGLIDLDLICEYLP